MSSIYVTAILVFIIVGIFLFCCYKKMLKRELNKEMQLQLNATVS